MEYRITKIKTKDDSFGTPVSISLSEAVRKMQSETAAPQVDNIARHISQSLLEQQELGWGRFGIKGMDDLPYLIFSATFSRQGLQEMRQPSGLMLLSVDYGFDMAKMQQIRQAASQLPQTVLVFRSISRRSLKIVVRCQPPSGQLPADAAAYEAFLSDAQQQAAKYYGVFCDCKIGIREESLSRGCRMSQDSSLYYNPDAEPLTIIDKGQSVLADYPNARTDTHGWTTSDPEPSERDKERADFYACRRKAREDYKPESDDADIQTDGELTLLAQYCRKSALPLESSVVRASRYYHGISQDNIRSIFRSVYDTIPEGRSMAMMSEKERIARKVQDFFERRYELRYNVMKLTEEFRPKGYDYHPWMPLTDRDVRRIAHEEMIDAGAAWSVDIELYVRSSLVKSYNPVHEFLAGCGKWDQKRDYIGEMARRVPNRYPDWETFFHRWFLGMVAQWQGRSRDFGNAVVPMLIGPQATHKSTFCKLLVPMGLREYYIDDIKMQNAEQVERMLGRMALVNIDEYNAKTDREQAKIKRILTEKDVQVRRMRSEQYVMTPRMASFIATTNERQPLNDPTGSRRYLCVEVTGIIDTDTPINYQQLYAQALWELDHQQPYYFTKEEETAIEQHNRQYQNLSTTEILLATYFEPAERNKHHFMRAVDILAELQGHVTGADKPNMKQLTLALKAARYQYGANGSVRGWYVKRR